MNIFEFKSYKDFLVNYCALNHGGLSRLSEAAGCQKSYLTTCIKGKGNLTIDQYYGIAEYLGFSDEERTYFQLLVDKERASSPKVRKAIESKCKELSRESFRLKNQQKAAIIITDVGSDVGFYYSTWLVLASHVLSSVPGNQTVHSLAKRLNMPTEAIDTVIKYLEKMDLIKKSGEKYLWNSSNLHLPDNSSWIGNHHTNWRQRAIENIQKLDRDATHYSAVQSFSEEDFEKLKRKIVQFVSEFNKVADPSSPEDAFCLNIDLFKV